MLSPRTYYQQQLAAGVIQADPQQQAVVEHLEAIYQALQQASQPAPLKWWQRWRHTAPSPVKGLYLWGSVGAGKTLLMDIFYHCCPVPKLRLHFHVFMQRIHAALRATQGTVNPLQQIAAELARDIRVLCFDEFFVNDITDAMLLGELFQQLFAKGVCVVATSNTPPEELYRDGLQRERFLPAIAALQRHTQVIHLVTPHDYRLTYLEQAGVYFWPLDALTEQRLTDIFVHLSQHETVSQHDIMVLGRAIANRCHSETVIWFDFDSICGVPRAQRDYIEIAKQFHTVLLSGVPVFAPGHLSGVTAFTHLIDVFYDAGTRVVIAAAAPIEELYPVGKLKHAFARVQSRLHEMQSVDYFKHDFSGEKKG